MLKKVLIGSTVLIVGVIVAFAMYVNSRPDTFLVQRSIEIKAPAATIFPLMNDFHNWVKWSPYEVLDPHMKRSYSGNESGKGAKYIWDGNEKSGAGTMEITESTPPTKVEIKLDFSKPFEGHNIADFTLAPKGDDETMVTWSMHGPSSTMFKVAGMFMSMDEMIGKDFETGLQKLKDECENK